jgi:hypothetical protein
LRSDSHSSGQEISPLLMEPEIAFPYSEEPTTGLYPCILRLSPTPFVICNIFLQKLNIINEYDNRAKYVSVMAVNDRSL